MDDDILNQATMVMEISDTLGYLWQCISHISLDLMQIETTMAG